MGITEYDEQSARWIVEKVIVFEVRRLVLFESGAEIDMKIQEVLYHAL